MGGCESKGLSDEESEREIQKCEGNSACRSSASVVRYGPKNQNQHSNASEGEEWRNGIIPYEIDSDLDFNRKRIMKAMRTIEQYSRMRFVERKNQRTFLKITRSDGCYFMPGGVGRRNLSLGIGCEDFGTILHELLHALGFQHEQRRPDRDNYIIINWKNIDKRERPQFYKLEPDEYRWSEFPFDYDSIMMYEEYEFSKNGLATIEALDGRSLRSKNSLSPLDKKKLRLL